MKSTFDGRVMQRQSCRRKRPNGKYASRMQETIHRCSVLLSIIDVPFEASLLMSYMRNLRRHLWLKPQPSTSGITSIVAGLVAPRHRLA